MMKHSMLSSVPSAIEPDRRGVGLPDMGLVGGPVRIRWHWRRLEPGPCEARAILLAHGHPDHAGNAPWAKARSGAPVYAHPLEQCISTGRISSCSTNGVTSPDT
jgi:glyoxylase-like metal-dependent hydrolase (beta-lactamase superfamily II)